MAKEITERAAASAAKARRRTRALLQHMSKYEIAESLGITSYAVDHWSAGRAGMSKVNERQVIRLTKAHKENGGSEPSNEGATSRLRDSDLGALAELAHVLTARQKIQLARLLLDQAVLLDEVEK